MSLRARPLLPTPSLSSSLSATSSASSMPPPSASTSTSWSDPTATGHAGYRSSGKDFDEAVTVVGRSYSPPLIELDDDHIDDVDAASSSSRGRGTKERKSGNRSESLAEMTPAERLRALLGQMEQEARAAKPISTNPRPRAPNHGTEENEEDGEDGEDGREEERREEDEMDSPPTPPPRISNPYLSRRHTSGTRSPPPPRRIPSRVLALHASTSRSPEPEVENHSPRRPTALETFIATRTVDASWSSGKRKARASPSSTRTPSHPHSSSPRPSPLHVRETEEPDFSDAEPSPDLVRLPTHTPRRTVVDPPPDTSALFAMGLENTSIQQGEVDLEVDNSRVPWTDESGAEEGSEAGAEWDRSRVGVHLDEEVDEEEEGAWDEEGNEGSRYRSGTARPGDVHGAWHGYQGHSEGDGAYEDGEYQDPEVYGHDEAEDQIHLQSMNTSRRKRLEADTSLPPVPEPEASDEDENETEAFQRRRAGLFRPSPRLSQSPSTSLSASWSNRLAHVASSSTTQSQGTNKARTGYPAWSGGGETRTAASSASASFVSATASPQVSPDCSTYVLRQRTPPRGMATREEAIGWTGVPVGARAPGTSPSPRRDTVTPQRAMAVTSPNKSPSKSPGTSQNRRSPNTSGIQISPSTSHAKISPHKPTSPSQPAGLISSSEVVSTPSRTPRPRTEPAPISATTGSGGTNLTPRPPGSWYTPNQNRGVRFSPLRHEVVVSDHSGSTIDMSEDGSVHRIKLSPRKSPLSRGNQSQLLPKSTTATDAMPSLTEAARRSALAKTAADAARAAWMDAIAALPVGKGEVQVVAAAARVGWSWGTWAWWVVMEVLLLWGVFRVTIDYATSTHYLSSIDPFNPSLGFVQGVKLPFTLIQGPSGLGSGGGSVGAALNTGFVVNRGPANFFDLVEGWGVWEWVGMSTGSGKVWVPT